MSFSHLFTLVTYHLQVSWLVQTCSTSLAPWRKPSPWTGIMCCHWGMSHPSWFCCHRLCPPKDESFSGLLAGTQCCTSQCLHWGPQVAASKAWLHWWTEHLPGHSLEKKDLERDHTQFCHITLISHSCELFFCTTSCLTSNIHVLFYSQSPTCAYLGTCMISVYLAYRCEYGEALMGAHGCHSLSAGQSLGSPCDTPDCRAWLRAH